MRQDGGPNQGMQVNINNNNGPDPREIPGDEHALHWYVPVQTPATRRRPPSHYGRWMALTVTSLSARFTHEHLCKALLALAKRDGVISNAKETARNIIHAVTGYNQTDGYSVLQTLSLLFGARHAVQGVGFVWLYNKIHDATKPDLYIRTLFCWRRHSRFISAVFATIATACFARMCYAVVRQLWLNMQPFEPEGISHPNLMCEVTQETALATPTHFACPTGLRAHILEKVFLQDRTPVLIQRVRSMAGKWCDENGINPNQRPAYIAGGLAAAMTVSSIEIDLLQYERTWEVQHARRLLAQHHQAGEGPPRNRPGFWEWLMRPGRR